jgi:hypothetical protein
MLKEFRLLYLIVVKVERPLSGYCAAWEPPTRSYLHLADRVSKSYQGFLRSAAHERVLRGTTIPTFHHLSDRCWVRASYYIRSSRVRLFISCCYKDTSICQRCQLVFLGIESGCYGENNYKLVILPTGYSSATFSIVLYVPILENAYFTLQIDTTR